jgi:DNA-binding response OmpR family regulator
MDILVVDDDEVVLRSCSRILSGEGHTVRLAHNAAEGLDALNTGSFDLIIVDIKMPEEDGISLINKSRRGGIETPILVMSGYPTEETIESSLASGAQGFIPKPFTPDELIGGVREATEGG